MRDLLKKELSENPENAATIARCIDSGEPIPDRIANTLVENRLKQSDCRVNGWVMEGFPENEAQLNLLKALRIKPQTVFLFEQNEDESVRRLQNRKLDPDTGIRYNMEINPPNDENIVNRLIDAQEDKYNVIKNKFNEWEKNLPKLEEHYKMVLNV
jgi:adenylate kinase